MGAVERCRRKLCHLGMWFENNNNIQNVCIDFLLFSKGLSCYPAAMRGRRY
jgi:hypothetical protein